MRVSVILPTYNPDITRLNQVINALQQQTISLNEWELIIVDNNSSASVAELVDVSWHSDYRIIQERNQGLTNARVTGFKSSKYDIIVMVDDDNVLDQQYLKTVVDIFTCNPELGAIGGKSLPHFSHIPPSWLSEFYENLALRDLGGQIIKETWNNQYPRSAPIGAGMGIRKIALKSYLQKAKNKSLTLLDRKGSSLASGGDNEIILEVLKSDWAIAYFPSLCLQHIIPDERIKTDYLTRLVFESNKSWVKLLIAHQISPWAPIPIWSITPRKIKAWFSYRAWKKPVQYIKWRGACGIFEGLTSGEYK